MILLNNTNSFIKIYSIISVYSILFQSNEYESFENYHSKDILFIIYQFHSNTLYALIEILKIKIFLKA